MPLALRLLRGVAASGPVVYVDSVGGSNANAGTLAAPKQTLAAAVAASVAGTTIRLKRGSVWREALNTSALSNITVEAYGSGAAPVIAGCDVITGWTNDGSLTNTWYKDVAHNSAGSNRQVAIENDALLNRVASASAANGTAGTYYCADSGTANPIRVWINVGGNPNTNGKTYEVTTRNNAVFLGANSIIRDCVARGAISNNGPIETGVNGQVVRCVAAFGTKHNALMPSGLMEDVVLADADAASATEPGVIPFVGYANDMRGTSLTLRRAMFYCNRPMSEFIYSHTQNDPAWRGDAITVEQCVGYAGTSGGGLGVGGGAIAFTVRDSYFNGPMTGLVSCYTDTLTILRVFGEVRFDLPAFQNGQGGAVFAYISQCGVSRNTVSGGNYPLIWPRTAHTVSVANCSLLAPSSFFGQTLGLLTDEAYTITVNGTVCVANSALTKGPTGTYGASNNNVFVRPAGGIGPFGTYNGTGYNFSSALAGWRTASGQDANSVCLTASPFTGTPANGDFRVDGTANGKGVTEYWDMNARAVVSGQPSRWPVGPRTYAEALAYIADPAAWNFYP